jgi:hypothetical protein
MGLGREIFITISADWAGIGVDTVPRRIKPIRPNNSFFIKHLQKGIKVQISMRYLTKLGVYFKGNRSRVLIFKARDKASMMLFGGSLRRLPGGKECE